MPLTFKPDWKVAKPHYVAKFGEYQAFLDSMTQTDVLNAIHGACGKFHPGIDAWMQGVSNGTSDAIVEQGSHQAEPPKTGGGGFTLHITLRVAGKANHLYLGQKLTGSWYIAAITYAKPGGGFEMVTANA
jgi:hypothetical protein